MNLYEIIALALGICCLLLIVLLAVLTTKKKKTSKIVDGTKYESKEENDAVTYEEGNVLLQVNITYTCKKNTTLIPGIYKVYGANENYKKFNIRLGGFVREYNSGDSIVLHEGDEITAVSHSVILK